MTKVLSVRLSREDEAKLRKLAEELDVGPSVLARMLLHGRLTQLGELKGKRFPISLLSELLMPAAQAQEMEPEALTTAGKRARQQLWDEHYGKSV